MLLGIYGTGGTGKEIYEIITEMKKKNSSKWDSVFFIDDLKPIGEFRGIQCLPFLEVQKRYQPCELEIVIAIGEPKNKTMLRERVENAGYRLATIIHPDSYISESAVIGNGVIIKMQTIIFADAIIGDNTCIQSNVVVGHDVTIGKDCQVSAFSHICGNVTIGERVFLGAQSGLREKVSIQNDCVIAMGAMVMNDMPEMTTCVGNPARIMKRKEGTSVF